MYVITVHIPPLHAELLKYLVDKRKYSSMSEAIRYAIRLLIKQEFEEDGEE